KIGLRAPGLREDDSFPRRPELFGPVECARKRGEESGPLGVLRNAFRQRQVLPESVQLLLEDHRINVNGRSARRLLLPLLLKPLQRLEVVLREGRLTGRKSLLHLFQAPDKRAQSSRNGKGRGRQKLPENQGQKMPLTGRQCQEHTPLEVS